MANFWQNLSKPIWCLAPMEEVTDFAFREMFARYSKNPHPGPLPKGEGAADFVMFTEFINVDGLLHPEGFEKLKIDLKYSEAQRPIVAQLWGREPEKFFKAAQLIADLGFDGVDINFGCPQQKEISGGTCAALIREPKLAQEIIAATKRGAGSLPVSVKTRLGYSKTDEMEGWVKNLLEMDIAALTIHARTKQEKSKVPAHWDLIAEAVKIRDEIFERSVIARSAADEAISTKKKIASSSRSDIAGDATPRNDTRTLIIGNGDIKSREEGLRKIDETKVDGVMVGRGAFGNPWFFRADGLQPDIRERLLAMLEHAELFHKEFQNLKSFTILRKHFKAYCSGFPGAHELRVKLMETKNLEETRSVVTAFLDG